MRLRLIRHATLVLDYAGKRLVVDPMLSDPAAMPAIENSPNARPNPLVPLPIPAGDVIQGTDAIFVTHTHRDHWDAAATSLVPKNALLFGQAADELKFHDWGFTRFQTIYTEFSWDGIDILRTGGEHGRGEIGKAMAPVSGFVLRAAGEPTLYIAGDTIWCREVERTLHEREPAVVVVNAGAAQFLEGGTITMDAADVIRTAQARPSATVISAHMESINHCLLTRADLAFQLEAERIRSVRIPNDGELVPLISGH